MIFIGGIHGVGKTYFCNKVKEYIGINFYSASELISKHKHENFSIDKKIKGIVDNQTLLIKAIDNLNQNESNYLLDGHFCLLNFNGQIEKIDSAIFKMLNPQLILILAEAPSIIIDRIHKRDGVINNIDLIQTFQNKEITYAQEIAKTLKIHFIVASCDYEKELALRYIKKFLDEGATKCEFY